MRLKTIAITVFAATVLLPGAGCGGNGAKPVKFGGVLKWDNGSPIAGAEVNFMPVDKGGKPAYAVTGSDGEFELTTDNFEDGAIPGKYKIIVKKMKTPTTTSAPPKGGSGQLAQYETLKKMEENYRKGESKKPPAADKEIPPIYTNLDTTPLQWTVESGGKAELKLKKAK